MTHHLHANMPLKGEEEERRNYMRYKETASRLKFALEKSHYSASELSYISGVSKASISQYTNGVHQPNSKSAESMAKVLGVNPVWLMGYDVPMAVQHPRNLNGLEPISVDTLPVLGEIACGQPIIMNEEREYYTQSGTKIKADFILIASGDSMTGARINDGDLVFIRQQQTVENGEIAAVRIGDEATLKRFYKYPEKRMIILRAANPAYEDMVYMDEQTLDVEVIGKAVAFQSNVN